jgi:hypothetical protein
VPRCRSRLRSRCAPLPLACGVTSPSTQGEPHVRAPVRGERVDAG